MLAFRHLAIKLWLTGPLNSGTPLFFNTTCWREVNKGSFIECFHSRSMTWEFIYISAHNKTFKIPTRANSGVWRNLGKAVRISVLEHRKTPADQPSLFPDENSGWADWRLTGMIGSCVGILISLILTDAPGSTVPFPRVTLITLWLDFIFLLERRADTAHSRSVKGNGEFITAK